MKIAIVFASTEGQTRKICLFATEKLNAAGHTVVLMPAHEASGLDLARFDAAILAASVHAGRFQKELEAFATDHADTLNAMRTLFLPVSLTAAGDDEEDWIGLRGIVADFEGDTGWIPTRIEHVAGALRFSEYDFFKYWAMRWIESQKDHKGEPGDDREYTDWTILEGVLSEWAA